MNTSSSSRATKTFSTQPEPAGTQLEPTGTQPVSPEPQLAGTKSAGPDPAGPAPKCSWRDERRWRAAAAAALAAVA